MPIVAFLVLILASALGCGDDGNPDAMVAPDGGDAMVDGGTDGIASPAAPEMAVLPTLTPCPAGFSEVAGPEGVTLCDPFGAGATESCSGDTALLPGSGSCETIDVACPSGEWADDLPASDVIYVRAGATGGDGSAGAPFGTISSAMSAAGSGDTVALAKGVYAEVVQPRSGVTVQGACAAETTVQSMDASDTAGVFAIRASDVVLRHLTVGSSERAGIRLSGRTSSVVLEGVVVEDVRGLGVAAQDGATITADGLIVRGTRGRPSDDALGVGVSVALGSGADLTRTALEGNRAIGAQAEGGATLRFVRSVVRDTREQESDFVGGLGLSGLESTVEVRESVVEGNLVAGIQVVDSTLDIEASVVRETVAGRVGRTQTSAVGVLTGSTATVTRSLIEGGETRGFRVIDPDSMLTVSDSVVRDVRIEDTGGAIVVTAEGAARVERTLFSGNSAMSVACFGAGASMSVEDVTIIDTLPRTLDDGTGLGIVAAGDGPSVTGSRVRIERAHGAAVVSVGAGTSVVLSDVIARDTEVPPDEGYVGWGAYASDGAAVEITRGSFERGRWGGLIVFEPGSSGRFEDVVVRGTRPAVATGSGGFGLAVETEATVEASRIRIEESFEIGISVNTGAALTLSDAVVVDTASDDATGALGRGLNVQLGATASVTRARFEGNHDVGVQVLGDATAELRDIQVVRTAPCDACISGDRASGLGVASSLGGNATVEGFEVIGSALCGLFVSEGSTLVARSGRVAESPIGACVQVDGYDLNLLMSDVRYEDNDVNLDSTSLPVPEMASELGRALEP